MLREVSGLGFVTDVREGLWVPGLYFSWSRRSNGVGFWKLEVIFVVASCSSFYKPDLMGRCAMVLLLGYLSWITFLPSVSCEALDPSSWYSCYW